MAEEQKQFNEQNVEWIDVNGQSQGSDSVKPPETPKKVASKRVRIAVFVVIAIVGIGLIVLFLFSVLSKRGREDQEAQRQVETAISRAEKGCADAENVEECLRDVRPILANDNGDMRYCEDLEGDAFDDCALLVAFSSSDISFCSRIRAEDRRASCEDGLFNETFGNDYGFDTCAEYNDDQLQSDCEQTWIRLRVEENDCSSEHVDNASCTSGEIIARAKSAQDPDICDEITDNRFLGNCLVAVGAGDRDFDGLDADDELVFGTDDTNPDTDGDGINDGEEVHKYGTNPAQSDTDFDGFSDKEEIDNGFDPLS